MLDDGLSAYLDRAAKTPLLTAEEEVDLAKRVAAGRAAAGLLEDRDAEYAPSDRLRLRRLVEDGDAAHHRLVTANLRLVAAMSRGWARWSLDQLDVIQEGNLGLIKAVDRFDHTLGYRFSTYAAWWVRQAISRGVDTRGTAIRIPVRVRREVRRLRRLEDDLHARLGRPATAEELADQLGVPMERLRLLTEAAQTPLPLDAPMTEGSQTVASTLSDEHAPDPELVAAQTESSQLLREVLETLPAREREVIVRRYGLDGEPMATLEQLGEIFGVTRERIRQIEVRTLRRLQASEVLAGL